VEAVLPFFGSSWLRRDLSYWVRRVAAVGELVAVLGRLVVGIVAVPGVERVWLLALGATVGLVVVVGAAVTRWFPRKRDKWIQGRETAAWLQWVVAGLALVGWLRYPPTLYDPGIRDYILGVDVAFAVGALALLVSCLLPELPLERRRRIRLGLPAPDDPARTEAVAALTADWL
jgi:hypothetical protein